MSIRFKLKRNRFTALICLFLLSAFSMISHANATGQHKVYGLLTYHTNEGKLPALQARFRDHTQDIFHHLGMNVIANWIPIKNPEAANTLIYILEHDSEEDAKQKWQIFINDPAWISAYQAS